MLLLIAVARGGEILEAGKPATETQSASFKLALGVCDDEVNGCVVVVTRHNLESSVNCAMVDAQLTMSAYLDEGCTKLS